MADRARPCRDGDHAGCTGYFDPFAYGYAGKETYRCSCECHSPLDEQ